MSAFQSIIAIVVSAIAFISDLKKQVSDLLTENGRLNQENADLRQQLVEAATDDAAKEQAATDAKAAQEAAEAKTKELEDAAAVLDSSGQELAAAITDHPDVPVTVDADFNSTPTNTPAEGTNLAGYEPA